MSLPWKLATVCVLREENRTLLIDYTHFSHSIHEGYYAPPGGKLHEGEDPIICTRREVEEETGIVVGTLPYRGNVKFHNEHRTRKSRPFKYNFEVQVYESRDFNMRNAQLTEGHGFVWVENNQLSRTKRDVLEHIRESKSGILDVSSAPISAEDQMLWHWIFRYSTFNGSLMQVGEQLAEYHVHGVLPDGCEENLRGP